jgi:hypothetical protein
MSVAKVDIMTLVVKEVMETVVRSLTMRTVNS